jgi:hypothetical protein
MCLKCSIVTIKPKWVWVLSIFLRFTSVMLLISYLVNWLWLCHVLCEYQFDICLGMIVAQLTYGYNARNINFASIENRCLDMCKICSFCLTRSQKPVWPVSQSTWLVCLARKSVRPMCKLDWPVPSLLIALFLCQVGDSATISLQEDKAELQVLLGYNFN